MRLCPMEARPRLLLVDDDADMRQALADALGERFEVADEAALRAALACDAAYHAFVGSRRSA